jgi:broad specificity phosphatase PhoE
MDTDAFEQKWPDRLVIVRHGESERNVAKELAKEKAHSTFGSGLRDADEHLTARGCQQAHETGLYLASATTFDVAFSSPYVRTVETTDEILKAYRVSPPRIADERLREIEFGILDGLTAAGIDTEHPKEAARRKREGKYYYRPPGGESRPDVALRVHSFLGTLTRDFRRKSVLVVCHSVVVLMFRRLLARWGEADYLKVDQENDVLNCGITCYSYDNESGKIVLEYYNQTVSRPPKISPWTKQFVDAKPHPPVVTFPPYLEICG